MYEQNQQQPSPVANPAAAGAAYQAPESQPPTDTKTVKEIEVDGYKFKVDMDLMDDIEAFEHIDRIENKGQIAAIVPLLQYMIGKEGVEAMKDYFTKKYGRFRLTKLMNVYEAIVANFDPKG